MNDRPTFQLVLRAEPRRYGDPPVDRRLAAALKCLLRSFGFRCLSVEEVVTGPATTAAEANQGESVDGLSRRA